MTASTARPSLATNAASAIFSAPSAAVHALIPVPAYSSSRAGTGTPAGGPSSSSATAEGTSSRAPSGAPWIAASCASRANAPRWLAVNVAEVS